MSNAYINPFSHVDFGRFGGGTQCFEGACSTQPRADVQLQAAWPAAPHLTVAPGVRYVAVYLSAPGLIYAGPPTDAGGYAAMAAAYPAGWWPMAVETGHVVAACDLGA